MNKRIWQTAVALAALSLLVGCGGNDDPASTTTTAAPAAVAGNWSGTFREDASSVDRPMALTLLQNQEFVNGELFRYNDVPFDVAGTVNGNELRLGAPRGAGCVLHYEGAVLGDRIEGRYEVRPATCGADAGFFALTRN